jgi:Phytanoyl-CoA dioxygenase (PhyH)
VTACVDRAVFERDGWCVTSEPVFDVDLMAAARAATADVCARRYATGVAPLVDLGDGPGELRKIDQAFWSDPTIASISTSPELGRLAAELLGVDEIRLWHDQLLFKPPGSGAAGVVGWHQDKGYWTATDTSQMITAWVAFDDVTEAMGVMRFVPGSHRWGRVIEGNAFFETDHDAQRAAAKIPDGELWTEAFAELRAGQLTFHHCKTLHGSRPNLSDRPRIGLAVHMMEANACRVPGRWHANVEWADVGEGDLWGTDARFPQLWPVGT